MKALMAKPILKDPLFNKSFVLIIDDLKNKKMGLILNKEMEEKTSEVWDSVNPGLVIKNKNLKHGGSVYGAVSVIHKIEKFSDKKLFSDVFITINPKKIEKIITTTYEYEMYVGYCSWSKDQFEKEMKNGLWWEVIPDSIMVFNNIDYWELKKQEKNKEYLSSLNLKIQNHMLN